MKKVLLLSVLSAFLFTGFSYANDISEDDLFSIEKVISEKGKNIQKMYRTNPEFFSTSVRSSEDIEMEKMIMSKFNEKFINKKNEYTEVEYNKLMNDYFIDALKTSNSNLADLILYNSGANIDVNYQDSLSPMLSPLMAVATALETDGGDIEYFIKLIELGANPSEVTKQYNIPIMSLAATVDNYKIVFYLAMIGENIMKIDDYEFYPLDYATRNDAHKTTIILSNLIKEYTNEFDRKK